MKKASTALKNWLLLNKIVKQRKLFIWLALFFSLFSYSQVANFVTNGSFEDIYPCTFIPNNLAIVKGWRQIDSVPGSVVVCNTCPQYDNVPYNGFAFQYPRTGNGYAMTSFLCEPPTCATSTSRGYLRNRLRASLQSGKIYCVKFYIVVTNNSTYGVDAIGAYFGDNSIDTISKCTLPLTYLNPQVSNPVNNIITDTLNWVLVTGTFVATGNEKHMLIGNFKSDANTNRGLSNPQYLPAVGTDICIDDVSCILLDLPAFAGNDMPCIPGSSVYIGRQRDVGIDEACTWYNMSNTLTPIANGVAGLTVNPVVTTTYIVKQEICGIIKWDTTVVYMSGVGLDELKIRNEEFRISPNPAKDVLTIEIENEKGKIEDVMRLMIYNNLGQLVREEDVLFKNKASTLDISGLNSGIYMIYLMNDNQRTEGKRVIIVR